MITTAITRGTESLLHGLYVAAQLFMVAAALLVAIGITLFIAAISVALTLLPLAIFDGHWFGWLMSAACGLLSFGTLLVIVHSGFLFLFED